MSYEVTKHSTVIFGLQGTVASDRNAVFRSSVVLSTQEHHHCDHFPSLSVMQQQQVNQHSGGCHQTYLINCLTVVSWKAGITSQCQAVSGRPALTPSLPKNFVRLLLCQTCPKQLIGGTGNGRLQNWLHTKTHEQLPGSFSGTSLWYRPIAERETLCHECYNDVSRAGKAVSSSDASHSHRSLFWAIRRRDIAVCQPKHTIKGVFW